MNTTSHKFEVIQFKNANDLWESLSPTRDLFSHPYTAIYRGQGDASWSLTPSLFRHQELMTFMGSQATSDQLIFNELQVLNQFAQYCDDIGVSIPNDSPEFREIYLDIDHQGTYLVRPDLWPNDILFELMALAQHHAVPTRLLDWTRQPYIAVYFAVVAALESYQSWTDDSELAIWVMNTKQISQYKNKFRLLNVAGSISPHVSAQSGLFTVHIHSGIRGGEFTNFALEDVIEPAQNCPLKKLTLPVREAFKLYELCEKAKMNGATIYPSADGAGKATNAKLKYWEVKKHLKSLQST